MCTALMALFKHVLHLADDDACEATLHTMSHAAKPAASLVIVKVTGPMLTFGAMALAKGQAALISCQTDAGTAQSNDRLAQSSTNPHICPWKHHDDGKSGQSMKYAIRMQRGKAAAAAVQKQAGLSDARLQGATSHLAS